MTEVTRQLFVLRHAKSSWDDPGLEDHERPLAPRGQRATTLIREHLRASEIAPDVVLCSSAVRAVQTLEGVAPAGEVSIEPELYDADESDLLDRLRQLPGTASSAMLIGHNPELQMLVARLAGDRDTPPDDLAAVRRKFPTAGLATLSFTGEWSALRFGAAQLTGFVRPRDLE